MKYVSSLFVTLQSLENSPPKVGQWVVLDSAPLRGQYLGKTKAGVTVVRWQNGKFGKLADCKSNSYLRSFAKVNGSK